MELYVFDRELNPVGILDSFFSLRWIRRYHQAGEFELHCPLNVHTLELLQRGNIIWKQGDEEAGFIKYRQLGQDAQGQETLVIKGDFLTGYLDRRIIWGQEILNTTAEVAMRTLVEKHAISPADVDRAIPLLELGELQNFDEVVDYQTSYKNLLEEIEKISNLSGLGYRVVVDLPAKQLLFQVYKGRDLTAGQSANPPAIFSNEFENVLEQEYIDSLHNYRNVALVAGTGEGVDRKLITVGTGMGLNRFELFVDARDLREEDEEGNPIQEADYLEMLKSRGQSKLAECADLQTFESRINVRSNLRYKEDFDLGDIVTCISKKWGVTINARITEVEEIYEQDGFSLNVTFGNSVPTLIDKIKQVVS